MDTTFGIGETHLQEGCYQTTGTDVVTCYHPSTLNHLLHHHEGITEVFGILHCRHVVAHLVEALSKGRTAEMQFVKGEVDMIETGVFVVHQYRLAHIAHLAAGAHNHRTRRDNLLAVGILLGE